MFSVIKGSETDLQANEIQLVWMKTLILHTCFSIMWFHTQNKYFKAQLASVKTLVDQVSNDTSRCHYLPRLDCSVAVVYCLHFLGGKS
jgi:isopentenyldiphosphate isomerase